MGIGGSTWEVVGMPFYGPEWNVCPTAHNCSILTTSLPALTALLNTSDVGNCNAGPEGSGSPCYRSLCAGVPGILPMVLLVGCSTAETRLCMHVSRRWWCMRHKTCQDDQDDHGGHDDPCSFSICQVEL